MFNGGKAGGFGEGGHRHQHPPPHSTIGAIERALPCVQWGESRGGGFGDFRPQSWGFRAQNARFQSPKLGILGPKLGIWGPKCENSEPKVGDFGPKVGDFEAKFGVLGLKK